MPLLFSLTLIACTSPSGLRSTTKTDAPEITEAPDVPDTAQAEDAPAMPDVPPAPDLPDVPDVPPALPGGCGAAPPHGPGQVTVTIDAGPDGDDMRNFTLSVPTGYDPNVPHKLIVGYAGTNWIGEQIRPYLNLEEGSPGDEIFVYPDPLWRDFEGWGKLGGWVLGPWATPAHGEQDLVFTEAVLDYMTDNYCIDADRIFATGHSWGGDMAMVASCFLGPHFRASVPVAANRPYWFEHPDGHLISCEGDTAVWTMFGIGDDHFSWQSFPGEFGDECRDFWLAERGCDGPDSYTDLGLGEPDECREYTGCSSVTRYCLYGPASAHQIPSYYSEATMAFFRSFL